MSYFQPSFSHPKTSSHLELPSLPLVINLITPKTLEEEMMASEVEGQDEHSEGKYEKEL